MMFHKCVLFSSSAENLSHRAYSVVHLHSRTAIRPTKTFSYFFTWRWEQNTFLKSFGLYIRNQD